MITQRSITITTRPPSNNDMPSRRTEKYLASLNHDIVATLSKHKNCLKGSSKPMRGYGILASIASSGQQLEERESS